MKKLFNFFILFMLLPTNIYGLIVYNGESVPFSASSTWDKNKSFLVESLKSPLSSPKHLRAILINKNWWGSAAYAPTNWTSNDITKYDTLSLWMKSNKNFELIIQLFDFNKNVSNKIKMKVSTKYRKFNIPLSEFTGVDLTKVTAVVFAVSLKEDAIFVLDIDEIELTCDCANCGKSEPTPEPIPDPTPVPDPTPDPIPVPEPTPIPDPIPEPIPVPEPTPIPDPIPTDKLILGEDNILQIHTIGDSITNHPSWRCSIFDALTQLNVKSEFIGSLTDQYPQCSQTKHDGHSGYNTNNTNQELNGWLSQISKPELTIIMLGTNDIAWWIVENESAIVTRLNNIITKVQSNSPNGTIFVATIPPESETSVPPENRSRQAMVDTYNKLVGDLVSQLQSNGSKKIHLVDVFSALALTDLYDGIHPNDVGATKIGKTFTDKIKSLLTLTPEPPAPEPVTTTMKTNGRFLYDACGQKMVLRGVNHMTCWTDWVGTPRDGMPMFPEIAKTGANVVRMSWIQDAGAGVPAISPAQLDVAMTNAAAYKLIPMPEIHDYTCKWSTSMIDNLINYWTSPEMLAIIKKHEKYMLLNFANEMSAPNHEEYAKEYSRAVIALRKAGINVPIVFDASSCGQDVNSILASAPTIIKNDPLHNVIFSLHIYWSDQSASRIEKAITDSVALNIPMIIGEFASVGVNCSVPILYKEIMKQSQLHEIGYLPWSWDNRNSCNLHSMTKDNNQSFDTLWGWALELAVTDPNSIKNTSVQSSCF